MKKNNNKNLFIEESLKLMITQVKSPIGRKFDQRQTLIGLGLNKINRQRIVDNNSSTMGMINKVKHLLKVENIK